MQQIEGHKTKQQVAGAKVESLPPAFLHTPDGANASGCDQEPDLYVMED